MSQYEKILSSASCFFQGIEKAEYMGWMFVIRSVFPNMDDTDARPTVITNHDDRVFSIFSGKWVNCVDSARSVSAMIR